MSSQPPQDVLTSFETTLQIDRSHTSSGARPSEANFVGNVRIFGYFERQSPSRLAGATVKFAPGARTPWKVNPVGQSLIVTSGIGWAQIEGEPIVEIGAGDVVWCPPGRRHWDGAAPDQAMTYVAVQEVENGWSVQFGDRVSDAEYGCGSRSVTPYNDLRT